MPKNILGATLKFDSPIKELDGKIEKMSLIEGLGDGKCFIKIGGHLIGMIILKAVMDEKYNAFVN